MATYYAIKKSPDGLKAEKFRFTVEARTAHATGEGYHFVKVHEANAYKTLTGKYEIDSLGYSIITSMSVHCCYNGREAAQYVAQKLGLSLI